MYLKKPEHYELSWDVGVTQKRYLDLLEQYKQAYAFVRLVFDMPNNSRLDKNSNGDYETALQDSRGSWEWWSETTYEPEEALKALIEVAKSWE